VKHRPERLAAIIQKSVGWELRSQYPNDHVSVTNVRMDPEAREATVWVSILGDLDPEVLMEELERKKGQLRSSITRHAELRYVPHLRFIYDDGGAQMQKLFSRKKQ